MSQNTSSAVMQQRASPRDEGLDDFPTPPWATRALIEHVLWPEWPEFDPRACFQKMSVWEPACNRGFMARPLAEYFGRTHFSDIRDYGWEGQNRTVDFLFPGSEDLMSWARPDWIITNPPFRLAPQFIKRAMECRPVWGIAVLVRTSFLEGVNRYQDLFSKSPPSVVAQFSERVPMVEGRFDPIASTATSYCWLIWRMGDSGTEMKWIPPCRKQLERPEDPRP
jgi:hypothetical protein